MAGTLPLQDQVKLSKACSSKRQTLHLELASSCMHEMLMCMLVLPVLVETQKSSNA